MAKRTQQMKGTRTRSRQHGGRTPRELTETAERVRMDGQAMAWALSRKSGPWGDYTTWARASELTRLSSKTIQNLATGETRWPRAETLEALADALGWQKFYREHDSDAPIDMATQRKQIPKGSVGKQAPKPKKKR